MCAPIMGLRRTCSAQGLSTFLRDVVVAGIQQLANPGGNLSAEDYELDACSQASALACNF